MFIVDSTLPQHKPLRRKIRALENYRDYFIAPLKRMFNCPRLSFATRPRYRCSKQCYCQPSAVVPDISSSFAFSSASVVYLKYRFRSLTSISNKRSVERQVLSELTAILDRRTEKVICRDRAACKKSLLQFLTHDGGEERK